jgi:hypothetical protein
VVIINLKIAAAGEFQVKAPVTRQRAKQMVKKADPGLDISTALAVHRERDGDIRFRCLACEFHLACAH